MRRLEIVHLRTAGSSFAPLARQIREAIGPDGDGIGVATVYRRRGLDTDVAVHLDLRGNGVAGPSALGLRLASALGDFGLVEHTVWEELT